MCDELYSFEERKNRYVDLLLDSERLNNSVQSRAKVRRFLVKLEEWSNTNSCNCPMYNRDIS